MHREERRTRHVQTACIILGRSWHDSLTGTASLRSILYCVGVLLKDVDAARRYIKKVQHTKGAAEWQVVNPKLLGYLYLHTRRLLDNDTNKISFYCLLRFWPDRLPNDEALRWDWHSQNANATYSKSFLSYGILPPSNIGYVMLVLVNELNFSTHAHLAVHWQYRINRTACLFYIIPIHWLLR